MFLCLVSPSWVFECVLLVSFLFQDGFTFQFLSSPRAHSFISPAGVCVGQGGRGFTIKSGNLTKVVDGKKAV